MLRALEPLEQMQAGDGVGDPAFLPWHHLKAHALVDVGELEAAERFIASAAELAARRANPLLATRLVHARGRLEFARHDLHRAAAAARGGAGDGRVDRRALRTGVDRAHAGARCSRRAGERRAAAATLVAAQGRFSALGAQPALSRCEKELAACGLTPSPRKTRDYRP